jgi:predicted acyl esterase
MVVEYVFRAPTATPGGRGAPPPRYRREDDGPAGMLIERDVAVPVRGGITVYADVFRPAAEHPAPVLVAWSPYGKHAGPQLPERYPDGGVAPGQLSAYTAFESPDPVHWTSRGYAVVNADIPGTWHSGGDAKFLSPEEAWSGHDLVEWIASARSWLDAHGGKRWGHYYSDEGLRRQQAFFDHFLLGRDTEISDWPRVRYQVRDRGHVGRWRTAADWPVPTTSYQPRYLDAATGMLTRTRPAVATVSYDSERSGRGRGRATFDFRFSAATEVVGGMKLRVWMSAPDADDLDVFVAVQKLDRYGDLVGFPFYAVFEDGPVALGWIRASHRELDQARSAPWQPVLAHRRELRLAAGEIVPLEIEILPSGTLFRPGETLRLVIQGTDVYRYPRPLIQALHEVSVNRGPHIVHSGAEYDSHLLMPVAPAGAG